MKKKFFFLPLVVFSERFSPKRQSKQQKEVVKQSITHGGEGQRLKISGRVEFDKVLSKTFIATKNMAEKKQSDYARCLTTRNFEFLSSLLDLIAFALLVSCFFVPWMINTTCPQCPFNSGAAFLQKYGIQLSMSVLDAGNLNNGAFRPGWFFLLLRGLLFD